MAAPYTTYGPGDSQTWPACTGHPNDPRTPECDDEPRITVEYLSIHAQTKQIEALIDDARYRLATDDAESFRDLLGLALMRMHELCIEAGVDDPDYGWTPDAKQYPDAAHPQAAQLGERAAKAAARRFAAEPVAITGFAELES